MAALGIYFLIAYFVCLFDPISSDSIINITHTVNHKNTIYAILLLVEFIKSDRNMERYR